MEKEKRHKADAAETEKRINTVYVMLLQGFVRKQILQYAAENWGIAERTTDDVIAKARQLFSHNIQGDTELKKVEILTQYHDLYQKNYEEGDYKECRNILKDIGAVLGIDAPKKTDITTQGNPIQQPTWIIADNSTKDE